MSQFRPNNPNGNSNSNNKKKKKSDAHKARKRFGQNFLQDTQVIDQIIRSIHPRNSEQIVEIGPGLGALTKPMLAKIDHLHVIELDRDLVARLQAEYPPSENESSPSPLTIIEADALTVNLTQLAENIATPSSQKEQNRPSQQEVKPLPETQTTKLRIIGNLPYNISTPLLFHLMEHRNCIHDMHFMLQKEVVDRMCAMPGNKLYGRLSVMLQYYSRIEALFDVPPTAFSPPPKVDSSIVRLIPYETLPFTAENPKLFGQIVSHAFNQRRKVIRNSISTLADPEQIEAAGIELNRRPEEITLEQFVELANVVNQTVGE